MLYEWILLETFAPLLANTLASTLGSIEKGEDIPSPPICKKQNDIPIIQTGDSSGDLSPEDSPNEYALNRWDILIVIGLLEF